MLKYKKIKLGRKYLETLLFSLFGKNIIIIKGSQGYIMCGYLNLRAAEKFKDLAIKIVGVSTIEDALKASVYSCSTSARKKGVRKGQPIKEVLKIIA